MLHPADDTYEHGGIVNITPCNLARIKATSRWLRARRMQISRALGKISRPRVLSQKVKISPGNLAGDRTGFSG
jgi:hypothetical protein